MRRQDSAFSQTATQPAWLDMLLRCGAQSRRGLLLLPAARRASQHQQQHYRGFLSAGSQLLKRLRRWQPSFLPAERPSRKRLWQELAESFDDGTPQGAETAAQFERLCAAVGRIISVEHSALSARLHEEYRRDLLPTLLRTLLPILLPTCLYSCAACTPARPVLLPVLLHYRQLDPSRPRPPSASSSQPEAEAEAEAVARADALCTALHRVLRSAGFDLTDVADEQRAKVSLPNPNLNPNPNPSPPPAPRPDTHERTSFWHIYICM